MTLKLIVGLANPGRKYTKTRHNAGAWYINILTKRLNVLPLRINEPFNGMTSNIDLDKKNIKFFIPTTFMNFSGTAVASIARFYQIKHEEILIAHDELDLLPGRAKFKFGGGHGGHNGLKDIINKLGNNQNFYRLRIGIGHPGDKNKVIDLVLSQASCIEQNRINKAINEAARCTEIWLKEGLTKATNQLHTFRA